MNAACLSRRRRLERIILLIGLGWFLLLSNRGVNMVDEGLHLLHSHQIAQGQVIYRDFLVKATPLGFIIQAALIKSVGPHLMLGRLYVVLQGVIVLGLCIALSRRLLEHPFSLVPPLLFIPFTVALGGFPHYNVDASFFLMVTLFVWVRRTDRDGRALEFFAGFFGAAAILSKQSMALPVLAVMAAALFMINRAEGGGRARRAGLWALSGMTAAALPIFVWLALEQALTEAWASLTGLFQMKRFLFLVVMPRAAAMLAAGLILLFAFKRLGRRFPDAAPWLWASALLGAVVLIALVPLDLSAPIVAAATALSLIIFVPSRPGPDRQKWLMVRVFALMLFLVSVLSGVDLGHVLIGATGAAFFAGLAAQNIFLHRPPEALGKRGQTTAKRLRVVFLAGLAASLVAGFYLDLGIPHLRYAAQAPRWQARAGIELPGLAWVRVPEDQSRELEDTVRWIKSHTRPDEKIFVYPWDLLLYVFTERLPATYDTFLYFELFTPDILKRVLADLEREQPRAAVVRMRGDRIAHVCFDAEARTMEGYLFANYQPAARFGDYQIMTRADP